MKTTFTITEEDFLDWYFNSGYDQSQEQIVKELGSEVRDELMISGKYVLNTQNIFDSVNTDVVPTRLVKYGGTWTNQPKDGELGDLKFQWKLELIKNK